MQLYCNLAGFAVAWVEKWENFKLSTLIFCSFFFFTSCRELEKKISTQSKIGITSHPSELNLSKVNATATIPLCVQIPSLARTRT